MAKPSGTTRSVGAKTASATRTTSSGGVKPFGSGSYTGMNVKFSDLGGQMKQAAEEALKKAKDYDDVMYVSTTSYRGELKIQSADINVNPNKVALTVLPNGKIRQGYVKKR